MTDNSNNPQDDNGNKPAEEVSSETNGEKETGEKEYDDTDYTTASYKAFLDKSPLLPHEDKSAFDMLVDDIEFNSGLELKTPMEYFLVSQICTLMQNVLRYEDMKIELMQSQKRPVLEELFLKTEDPTCLDLDVLKGIAFKNANMWFANPEYRASATKSFESAGYKPNALETEAFRRSLPSLTTLDRLVASAQKRILTLMKELEKRCRDREADQREE